MTVEQTLEAKVTGVLNEIRTEAGKLCLSSLHYHNSPLIMSLCGSKGSPINIAQMVACVGQQSVNGARCPNGFPDRTLPHFPKGDKTPQGEQLCSGIPKEVSFIFGVFTNCLLL